MDVVVDCSRTFRGPFVVSLRALLVRDCDIYCLVTYALSNVKRASTCMLFRYCYRIYVSIVACLNR